MFRFRAWLVTLATIAAISIGINVLQARYIAKLLRNADEAQARGGLAVGALVPPMDVADLSGAHTTISYNDVGRPTLVYVFSPSCVWCRGNAAALKELSEKVMGRYRVVGISLNDEGLREFVSSHGMAFPVYSGLSHSAIETYHLEGTPETIIVSPKGAVLASWKGAYVGETKSAVERFFSITLDELGSGGA